MADFCFYATRDESRALVASAMNGNGLAFLPDISYSSPHAQQFETLTDAFWKKLVNNRFFVVGVFTIAQVVLTPTKEQDGSLTINQGRSGPMIEVRLPGEKGRSGEPCLNSGLIGFHPYYWDSKLEHRYPAPNTLLSAHRAIVATITMKLKRRKLVNGSLAWIAPTAEALVADGKSFVRANGELLGFA